MSHYTTEVRFICEQLSGEKESVGYSDVESVIEKSRTKIFDFDFPIYDEAYRPIIETKILKRYYTREIGFETVALWKFWLNKRLNEIMPYYNQLYKSTLLEFNPLYDTDYTTTSNANKKFDEANSRTSTATGNNLRTDALKTATTGTETNTRTDNLHTATDSTEESTNGNTSRDLYSDTPQGALTGVEAENYLTNARKVTEDGTNHTTNSGTVTNTGTQAIDSENSQETNYTGTQKNETTNSADENGKRNYTDTSDYLEHVAGKRGGASYSAMLQEYRDTFINIDVMIINELSDLFMNVW